MLQQASSSHHQSKQQAMIQPSVSKDLRPDGIYATSSKLQGTVRQASIALNQARHFRPDISKLRSFLNRPDTPDTKHGGKLWVAQHQGQVHHR